MYAPTRAGFIWRLCWICSPVKLLVGVWRTIPGQTWWSMPYWWQSGDVNLKVAFWFIQIKGFNTPVVTGRSSQKITTWISAWVAGEIAMIMRLPRASSRCWKLNASSARYMKQGTKHGQKSSITSSLITIQDVAMGTMEEYLRWSLKKSIMRSCQLCRKLGACQMDHPNYVQFPITC